MDRRRLQDRSGAGCGITRLSSSDFDLCFCRREGKEHPHFGVPPSGVSVRDLADPPPATFAKQDMPTSSKSLPGHRPIADDEVERILICCSTPKNIDRMRMRCNISARCGLHWRNSNGRYSEEHIALA